MTPFVQLSPIYAPTVSLLLGRIGHELRTLHELIRADESLSGVAKAAVPKKSWPAFWGVAAIDTAHRGLAQVRPLVCYAKSFDRWALHGQWVSANCSVPVEDTELSARAEADTLELLNLTDKLLRRVASKILALSEVSPALAVTGRLFRLFERANAEVQAFHEAPGELATA